MTSKPEIKATFIDEIKENLAASPQFIQVLLGPRQVGKTTGILKLVSTQKHETHYAAADDAQRATLWIEEQWNEATTKSISCLLVLDEIQKIENWSETIKKLWDKQRREKKTKIKLILLGSSSLKIQKDLSESLTGRFQLIRAYHWGYADSKKLRKMSLEEYLYKGGYPGSYALLKDSIKWRSYLIDSVIETVIGKDILRDHVVKSPALFRQCFYLLCSYLGQEISYTKLLGQLQDKGNTDLIKAYIELFEGAYLIKALQKYSAKDYLKRASSPKIISLCPALQNIQKTEFTKSDLGRSLEVMVGAALAKTTGELYYWRDGNFEVDYIYKDEHSHLFAIEVKSHPTKIGKGMVEFIKRWPKATAVFVRLENFEKFSENPAAFLKRLK